MMFSMLLSSSAAEPLRSTMALSSLPDRPMVCAMPCDSIGEEDSTKTTSATPRMVAIVVAFRTNMLRML